jgi:hypothetical protein
MFLSRELAVELGLESGLVGLIRGLVGGYAIYMLWSKTRGPRGSHHDKTPNVARKHEAQIFIRARQSRSLADFTVSSAVGSGAGASLGALAFCVFWVVDRMSSSPSSNMAMTLDVGAFVGFLIIGGVLGAFFGFRRTNG